VSRCSSDEPDDAGNDDCGECDICKCACVDGGDVAAGHAECETLDAVLDVLHVCIGKDSIKAHCMARSRGD
jgi:hypothetical protein